VRGPPGIAQDSQVDCGVFRKYVFDLGKFITDYRAGKDHGVADQRHFHCPNCGCADQQQNTYTKPDL
jgi:hypothetical protein